MSINTLIKLAAETILDAIQDYRIVKLANGIITNVSCHRYMLFGPPSVGKSTWAYVCEKLAVLFGGQQPPVYRLVLHDESGPDDFLSIMGLSPNPDGTFPVTDTKYGPAPLAMGVDGHPGILVIDEFDRKSPTSSAILHSVLDDLDRCQLRLPTGQVVIPDARFTVVCTSNQDPNTFLDEALLDRFDIVLAWVDYAKGIIASLPEPWGDVLSQYRRTATYTFRRGPDLESVVTYRAIRNMLTLTDVFTDHLKTHIKGDREGRRSMALELAAYLTFGPDTYREILSVAASHDAWMGPDGMSVDADVLAGLIFWAFTTGR